MAEWVGFEPTGQATNLTQKISSLRHYDHFGTTPDLTINVLISLKTLYGRTIKHVHLLTTQLTSTRKK